MATPTPVGTPVQLGSHFSLVWSSGRWPGTPTDFTDQVIVDLSSLTDGGLLKPEALKIEKIQCNASAGIEVIFQFSDDRELWRYQEGVTGPVEVDFTDLANGAMHGDAAEDLEIDTLGAAQNDSINIKVIGRIAATKVG